MTSTLQDMISAVYKTAQSRIQSEKIAKDMSKKTDESKGAKKEMKDETKEEKVFDGSGHPMAEKEHVEKLAAALDYIADNTDQLFPASVIANATKLANIGDGPGRLKVTESRGGDGTKGNWPKDRMAVGEDPSDPETELANDFGGPKNSQKTNLKSIPGGALGSEEGPLLNKSATFKAVLAKLAGEDVLKAKLKGGSSKSPGTLKTMTADESGKVGFQDLHKVKQMLGDTVFDQGLYKDSYLNVPE